MTLGNFEKHHILKLHGYFWGNLEFFGHFFPHTVTLLPYITWVTYWSIYNTTHGGHLLGTYKVRLFKKERIYMLRFQEPNFREWTISTAVASNLITYNCDNNKLMRLDCNL